MPPHVLCVAPQTMLGVSLSRTPAFPLPSPSCIYSLGGSPWPALPPAVPPSWGSRVDSCVERCFVVTCRRP